MLEAVPTIKLANNLHPILDALRRRWSSRAVSPQPLPTATVASVLEAARWAPSGGNGQPARFIVLDGRDAAARADGEACLNEGNAWAKRAPVLLIGVTQEIRENGQRNEWARHDLGLATENLLIQAVALGLVAHPMAGFSAEEARRRFAIPEAYTPMTMIALGYPDVPTALDEKQRASELAARTRKPLAEIAIAGRWGTPYAP